jgi:HD-like signal output (HDOD) protein/ActR/RegA family two-component response regulator
MKKQILFVDDDCNILEGWRRRLYVHRNEWDMQFVMSGEEALEIMNSKDIDLIISDMRMPSMDGADLLKEVMKQHPGCIRMIFSGQSDSALTIKAVGVTHQFLSKPCDIDILVLIIQKAFDLKALLQDGNLKNIISQMDALPSVPVLYQKLLSELQIQEPSIQKIGQIISQDPAMTAKILQLVNSAFFGVRRQISNAAEAVSYLGLDRVQNLFLAIHAFSQFESLNNGPFSIELLWEHSMTTALSAKSIAEDEEASKNIIDDAFTSGLLHDIGILMLACRFPEKYAKTIIFAKGNSIPIWEAEQEFFSTTHAEIGAYLLGLWGLPSNIVEATAYHHRPGNCIGNKFSALTALHAADCKNPCRNISEITPTKPDLDYLSACSPKLANAFTSRG